MPQVESVSFEAVLQGEAAFRFPSCRQQCRIEACQVLRVDVRVAGSFGGERFLAEMTRDGYLISLEGHVRSDR